MNRKFVLGLSLVASLALVNACDDGDSKKNPCGNGTLDAGEKCDGTKFAADAKVCAEDKKIGDETKFTCSDKCEVVAGVGACVAKDVCGDEVVTGEEECDKTSFATGENDKRVCPVDQAVADSSKFTCSDECKVVVGEGACGPKPVCTINNTLDAGEKCDGDKFAEGAKTCEEGFVVGDEAAFTCTDACEVIPGEGACVPEGANLLFSEVLYNFEGEKNTYTIYEIANLGAAADLSKCKIYGVSEDKTSTPTEYTIVDTDPAIALDTTLAKNDVYVVCAKRQDAVIPQDLSDICDKTVIASADLKTDMFACIFDEVDNFGDADALAIVCTEKDVKTVHDTFAYCGVQETYMENLKRVCALEGSGNSKPQTSVTWVSIESNEIGAYACSTAPAP